MSETQYVIIYNWRQISAKQNLAPPAQISPGSGFHKILDFIFLQSFASFYKHLNNMSVYIEKVIQNLAEKNII